MGGTYTDWQNSLLGDLTGYGIQNDTTLQGDKNLWRNWRQGSAKALRPLTGMFTQMNTDLQDQLQRYDMENPAAFNEGGATLAAADKGRFRSEALKSKGLAAASALPGLGQMYHSNVVSDEENAYNRQLEAWRIASGIQPHYGTPWWQSLLGNISAGADSAGKWAVTA